MKHHEREFLISQIRTGNLYIIERDVELVIKPPTLEQNFKANLVYKQSYEQSLDAGIMPEEQLVEWMIEHDFWSREDEDKIKGYVKDLEKLKKEIYNARDNDILARKIRLYLRSGEKQLSEHISRKNLYFSNSCEGIAVAEKTAYIIKNTTYENNEHYDFSNISLQYVIDEWYRSVLSEQQARELVRNEPWRSIWNIRQKGGITLFDNQTNTELTSNQKQLIVWSQIYDNVQESLECPSNDVIEDDDMLDGWFLIQAEKRAQEKNTKELDESIRSDKIKNSGEIFITAKNDKQKDKVNSLNNVHSSNIKNQRLNLLKNKNNVQQHEFEDEQLKIRMQRNNMFRKK